MAMVVWSPLKHLLIGRGANCTSPTVRECVFVLMSPKGRNRKVLFNTNPRFCNFVDSLNFITIMNTNEKFFWVVKFPVACEIDAWHPERWDQVFTFFGTYISALYYFVHPDFFHEVANCQSRMGRSSVVLKGGAVSVECFDVKGARDEVSEKLLFSKVGVIFEWDEEVLSAFGSK